MCWGSTAGAAVVVADGAVLATVAEVEVARRRTIVFTQWNVEVAQVQIQALGNGRVDPLGRLCIMKPHLVLDA